MPQCQFLFSAVFVFQKSCTGNILRIARDKNPKSYFPVTKTEPEDEVQEVLEGPRQGPGEGPGLAAPGLCLADSGPPSRRLFAYQLPPDLKVTGIPAFVHEKSRSSAASRKQVSGDRSLCSGTLPGRGIAPGAISIDSTAIFIAVADSHDEEGVVLPRG